MADLHRAILEILGAAIEAGGSTLADDQYVELFGQPGPYQLQHRVYGREGRTVPAVRSPQPGHPRPLRRSIHVLLPSLPALSVLVSAGRAAPGA